MSVAALQATLLKLISDKNFYSLQEVIWSDRLKQQEKKVTAYEKRQTNWEKAYNKVMDADSSTSGSITYNGNTVELKTEGIYQNETVAKDYANYKEPDYNEYELEEETEWQTQYEILQETYETLLTQTQEEISSVQEKISQEAQSASGGSGSQ